MSKDIEKYTNWRAITESDYVTMFIKTWFAFVATLRSLYPDIEPFADDGKPRGDRPFTNKFKEADLVKISQDVSVEEFSNIIYKLYVPSREKIAKEFKQYFLSTFYRINETFNFKENNLKFKKADRRELKERTAFDLRIKNRFTLSIIFQIYGFVAILQIIPKSTQQERNILQIQLFAERLQDYRKFFLVYGMLVITGIGFALMPKNCRDGRSTGC